MGHLDAMLLISLETLLGQVLVPVLLKGYTETNGIHNRVRVGFDFKNVNKKQIPRSCRLELNVSKF
jgi:hypothetical protein